MRNMSLRRVSRGIVCVSLLASMPPGTKAQSVSQKTALSGTVSIGDVVRAEDKVATQTATTTVAVSSSGQATQVVMTNASPIHLIYVHGINQIGPNDSTRLRKGICKYLKECIVRAENMRFYANGPFGPKSDVPNLTYLQQRIWSSKEEWIASTPFIQRYWISGGGHAPIVLDELNWYPLAYTLKCKFLLPSDELLAGEAKTLETACRPSKNLKQGDYFLQYQWPVNKAILDPELRTQHATSINRKLKMNLMDWGFGDAVMALGPMQEVLCAAIRQLLSQSLENLVVDQAGAPVPVDKETMPVFFVTHSLGSFLSLAAMDSDWLGARAPELAAFQLSGEQKIASDYFAAHTTGFYFLANQIALLELARLTPCAAQTGNCVGPARDREQPVLTASGAVANYGRKRQDYLDSHPASATRTNGPQIIAWSAADDLLSWYVPKMPDVTPINLPAKNSSFRIPGLMAGPTGVHDNYAENRAIVRAIFLPTKQ